MIKNKILLVASNGGHLVQLKRLAPSYNHHACVLVSTSQSPPSDAKCENYYNVMDSNNDQKLKLLITALQTFFIFICVRPKLVISTGAAPGLFCVLWAWTFRRKAIWIDSIANTEQLSMAGRLATKLTRYCYSQWPNVAEKENVKYIGSVL